MYQLILFFKKRPHFLILGLIVLTGIFLRSYKVVERFEFAHDGDLYSWIVKDIVVNHHIRLIGQLTSAPGIFIGALFYYLLIPFFLLFNMDPIGTIYFAILVGFGTIISYYFVFSRLFKIGVGLIAASLYAGLLSPINSDRWVVPTITTNLWVVWYFYTIITMARGDFRILPFLGILIPLIWHVHIALFPVLIAIPVSIIFSKKLPNTKHVIQFLMSFFITSIPFFVFEGKHGFQQIIALKTNFMTPVEGVATGLYKFTIVLNMITKNINVLLFEPQSFKITNNIFFVLIIFLSAVFLVKKNILLKKELIIFFIWILGVIAFFGFSHSPISEYYFSNIEIIFITIVSLYLYLLFKSSFLGKILVVGLLILIPAKNAYFMITQDYYNKGYLERKAIVNYIDQDLKTKGYPCIGITYITAPGENVGFRYFFYLKKIHLVHPSLEIPTYNIVIPDELSKDTEKKFGHIGVITPTSVPVKIIIDKSCQTPDTNLTDPVFGYTD